MSTTGSITVHVPLAIRPRPGRKTIVRPAGSATSASIATHADPAMIKALARAMDACAWGEQQDDVHPSWHVLDLDNPAAEPRILPPRMRTPVTGCSGDMRPLGTGESGIYILCWTETSYHLIGPFEDNGQCTKYLNWDEVHPDFDGPCDDPRWAVLRLDAPPSPEVVPSALPPLSEDEVQQRRVTLAKENELLEIASPGLRRNLSAWPGPSFLHSWRALN